MKYWNYVEVPNWTNYQSVFESFILEQLNGSVRPYNFVSVEKLEQRLPEFKNLLEAQFDSTLERIMVFVMTEQSMTNMFGDKFVHIDSGEQKARLNWPILNSRSVVTKYFDIIDPTYQPKRIYINPPYKDFVDVYDAHVCKEVSSVCVDRPTVFTVTEKAHGMYINENHWPRVMASINFFDDTKLLKYLN
jgi:hypothetical protein